MRSANEKNDGQQGLKLTDGRLIARPGPDLYLYAFSTPGGPLPMIGRRGRFVSAAGGDFPAKVADRRGPELAVSLIADKPLGPRVNGVLTVAGDDYPPLGAAESQAPEKGPAGLARFLDPQDGWLMLATEAAGWKPGRFDESAWPVVGRAELPGLIARAAGPSFIWSQKKDEEAATAGLLAAWLAERGSLIVLGDAPADLEPLAGLPGAVFAGAASPGTPLHPLSIFTKTAEAVEAYELELGRLRNDLARLKSEEASLKAGLGRWEDLARLKEDWAALGRQNDNLTRDWARAEEEAEAARLAWAEAQAAAGGRKGLLGFFKAAPAKAQAEAEEKRQSLAAAETTLALVRREEERLLGQVLQLEKRLAETSLESELWRPEAELAEEFEALKEKMKQGEADLARALARPRPAPADFLKSGPILALAYDYYAGEPGSGPMADPAASIAGRAFQSILLLCSLTPDHRRRGHLAALALRAEERLVVLGDFTLWPVWNGRAPLVSDDGRPAWSSLIVAEDQDEGKMFLARGRLFDLSKDVPPASRPRLARLEPSPPLLAAVEPAPVAGAPAKVRPAPDESRLPGQLNSGRRFFQPLRTHGLAWRERGQLGPLNPVSALSSVLAAAEFAAKAEEGGPAAVIITASEAQGRLARLMLADLGIEPGRVFAGEPADFDHWPQVPLVIIEPAFEAPHPGHPWAWPSYGQGRLMAAWLLAEDQLWIAGRPAWMERLPKASPLGALWRRAQSGPVIYAPQGPKAAQIPFWEALDKAKDEVWAIMPPLAAFWWRPLEEHFLAASRRGVRVTILTAPPGPEADSQYVAQAIRTLGAYGCRVHLALGLPGFLAGIDGGHLSWGSLAESSSSVRLWAGLKSAVLPRAGAEIGLLLQIDLINEKMGRGGFKNCRACGWPLVLVNENKVRGPGEDQPFKVDCLKACGGPGLPRRLDERAPFSRPPRCGLNPGTLYQRVKRGRNEFWLCPDHPEGGQCPEYRVVPGDAEGA